MQKSVHHLFGPFYQILELSSMETKWSLWVMPKYFYLTIIVYYNIALVNSAYMKGKILLLTIFLSTAQTVIYAQSQLDSLLSVPQKTMHDSSLIEHLFVIAEDYYIYHENKLDSAIHYTNRFLDLAKKTNHQRWIVAGYNLLGKIYNTQENLDQAVIEFENAMDASLRMGDSNRYAQILDNFGYVLVDQGKYDEALAAKKFALSYFKKHSDDRTIAIGLFGIGWIYMEREMPKKGIPYFYQALQYQPDWKLLHGEIYGNLASMYRSLENIDSAMICYKITAELSADVPSMYALNMNDFAILQEQIGALDSAAFYLKELLELKGLDQNSEIFQQYQLNYARVLSKLNRQKDATQNFSKVPLSIARTSNQKYLTNYYNTGYAVKKAGKDFKSALDFHEQLMHINDSIQNSDMQERFKDIETKYETAVKNEEIARLALVETVNKKQLANQRNWIIGLVVGLGALLFLLQRIFSQKNEISKQKTALTKALSDKNVLLKEIHHRVKNNLQVVSSLLGLQSRYVEDQIAQDAIKTGRARVQSMSLLHQSLYKNENLKSVNIQKYFEDLGHNLFTNYRLNEKDISFHSDIDDVELDIDVVVPMGLITNELISNSLKYAFEDQEKGRIDLSIKRVNSEIVLIVKDNGKGIPFTQLPERSKSLGIQLIKSFAHKLQAKIEISNTEGTSFKFRFNPSAIVIAA